MNRTACNNDTLGQRIRGVRKNNLLSQAEFIERIGKSVNFLSDIENDKKMMSLDTLKSICLEYDISADYLLFGISEQEKQKELIQLVVERGNECSIEQIDTIVAYFKELRKMKKEIEK